MQAELDDDALLNEPLSFADIGVIKIDIRRLSKVQEQKVCGIEQVKSAPEPGKFHQRSKKAMAHHLE